MAHHLPPDRLKNFVTREATELGFNVCRIATASLPEIVSQRLQYAIENDRHATMAWMAETLPRRKSPTAMWADAKSAIMLGMNYGPDENPLANLEKTEKATISVYARNRDYHDLIKGKLKQLAGKLASRSGNEVKVFVDTAPLLEKPLGQQSGVGWQGKHTNLVSREFGSWLFLGVILTTADLEADAPETDHCGNCHACLDICPTDAFPAPYQLDARRCISYLTIEHKGMIDRDLRSKMGNRIYGCDDCLAVCPWNKFARQTREVKLKSRNALQEPDLKDLLSLDDTAFRKFFSGSPIKRIGRNRFIRNVLIAAGNSQKATLAKSIQPHLASDDAVIRGTAVWSLKKLQSKQLFAAQRDEYLPIEQNEQVRTEWHADE